MNFDKFLRYTIPVLVSLLTYLLLITLENFEDTKKIIATDLSLGYIAGLIVVTGGLGAIYNNIYWAICHFIYYPLNHTALITSLKNQLKIKDSKGNIIAKITKREGWSIFNTYWYSKTNLRTKFEAINPRIDRLSDVTHGLGTTLIGLVLTFILWLLWNPIGESSSLLPILVGILLILLTFLNYFFSLKMYQTLLNTTFASILNEEIAGMVKEDPNKSFIEIILVN